MFTSPYAHAEDDRITMNFEDADIKAIIKFVAEFSDKNFLVDNRVRGKVTIISPAPISTREAYQVFLSILEVNGFTTVKSGGVIKIIPRAEGKQKTIPVRSSGYPPAATDELITQVMRLEHTQAQQLVAVLRPMISPHGNMVAYVPANMLIIVDSSGNIRRIMQIIKALDISDAVGLQMFELQNASATKLAQTLRELYTTKPGSPALGMPSGISSAAGSGSVKIIVHEPGNLIILVGSGLMIREVGEVIARLDTAPKPDTGRLQVRYLQNARAVDVAKVLNGLTGEAAAATGAAQAKGIAPKHLFAGDVKIVADEATNALLISADAGDRMSINKMIDQLDIRRLQVFVEALIVEVRGGTVKQLGIEWLSGKQLNNNLSVVGGQNFGSITTLGSAITNLPAGTNATTAIAAGLSQGLQLGVFRGDLNAGQITLGGILSALESNADVNVLSTPNLMTMDNEEAEIIVGQNVPFVTGTNTTQGGVANPFQTIERRDVGLTLRVTPQISQGDTIRLQIYQEISSVEPAAQGASDIVTNKRSIKTVVLANNNQIIILGGLMRDDASETVKKTPCLGSIPLLGEPFKFTDIQHQKTNLMVFLRPKIISTVNDINDITQKKYMGIRDVYEQQKSEGTIFFPDKRIPMPEDFIPTGTPPSTSK
ncbi:MAG: type II secretion system secretin GspD [Mariprofundales bacterium]